MTTFWQQIKQPYVTSLRRRVRLGMALVALVAAVLVMVGVELFVYRTERDMWEARQQDAAHGAARTVEAFLSEVKRDLGLVGSLDRADFVAAPSLLETLLAQNPALLEVVRLSEDGSVLASAHQPESTPVLANLFTLALSNWFAQAQDGQPYISAVQLSATNEPYLILAIPAAGRDVVAARLRMTMLWDVVAAIRYGDTGRAYVIDLDGNVIAHPNPDVMLASTRIDLAKMLPGGADLRHEHWLGDYTNFEKSRVIGSTIPIASGEWVIVTEIARHEGTQTTAQALLILGGGALLLGGAIFLVANQMLVAAVLRPIELLRSGARHMGAGHLEERIAITSQDEIGGLADEFNEMAARLQQKIEESEMLAAKANNANAFKSRLISRVSHELRNPLGGILGFCEMMQYGVYGELAEPQQEALGRISNSAHYLAKLVNELLEQSRLEGNRVALTVTEFDPRPVIASIVDNSMPAAASKGLLLETDFSQMALGTVAADQGKLEQVVANLVSNAIKFTENGSVRVRMFRPKADHWAIEVRDTGIGILPEAQEYIFEPFRQVDESITREYEGFGLGLSIVKHLTTLMNGEITVESRFGAGSTFTVTLPVRMTMHEHSVQSSAAD